MLLPGLLGLLWMLRAPLGATGTLSVASKPPFSALSHATSTQAATQPPPNSPVPRDRENTPTSLTKATSETPLSSPVPSEASTTPKFVIRVETTPPTLLVYTPNTECVNPPRLGVTSTYSTTTCVPRTPVPHSGSSYTMTLGTDKPVTPTTSPATTMISPPTVEDPPSTSGPLPDTTRHSLTSTTRATERTTLLPSSVHRVSPILGTTSVSAAISSLTPTKPVSVTASTHTGLLSTPLTPGTLSTMAVPTATPTITRISSETTSTGPPATTAATSQTTVTTPSGTYTGQPTLRHTSDFSTASLKRESIFTTLNASSKATKNALFSETSSTSPVSTASPSTSHSTPSFTHSSSHPTYSTPTTVTSSPATSLDTTETSTSTTQSSLRTHPPTIPTTSLPTSSLGSTDSTSSHTAPSTAHTLSHTSLSSSSMHSAQTPQPDSTALTLTPGLTTTLTGAGSTITLATSVPGTPDTSITMPVSPLLTSVSQTPNSPAPSEFPADASDSSPTLSSLTQTPSLPLSSLTLSSDVPVTNTRLSTPKTSVSTPIFLTSVTSSGESSTEWFPQGSTSTNAVITSIGTLIPSTPSVVMSSPPPSISSDLVLTTSTTSVPTSSHVSSTDHTGSSSTTAFSPLSSSTTTRTSPASSSPATTLTETTPFSYISLLPTTPCPETVTITIVPTSPMPPCVEVDPNTKVPWAPTTPFSVFPSATEMVTIPSLPSERTVLPTSTDATSPMTPETEPAHVTTGAPSSLSAETVPMNTALTSAQTTSENWLSSNSVSTPSMAGSAVKPSSNLPTVATSSKLTHPTPPTTRSPEMPEATTQTPTTLTSPRTVSSTTPMTTVSRLTTTPGTCENGGTWEQGHCTCLPDFLGNRCEHWNKCQNGGKFDGFKCICPSTFYGSSCEIPVEQIEIDTVEAEVGIEVSVDQEFSADLKDNTSTAYREFSNLFQNQMKKIYKNVAGFQGVEILSLRNGSIVVDYLVLLKLPFSSQLESDYEKVKTALKEELRNVSQSGDSCQDNQTLCFKPDSIKVNNTIRTELNLEAICHKAAAKGYEEFYFPLVKENRLRCVTNCSSDVDGSLDCNQGQCFLGKSGPACRCFSTDWYWFSGPRCEVAVPWRALVGGLAGAGALLLLLLLGALSFWVARSRRKDSRSRAKDREWFESWDDDTVGTFSNMGFEDDRTVKDANFQVALQAVDPKELVHIQRPELISSSL